MPTFMPLQQFKKELSVSRRLSGLGSVPEVTGEMTTDSALWESLRAPKKILNFGTKIKAVLWIFWVFMPTRENVESEKKAEAANKNIRKYLQRTCWWCLLGLP